MCDNYDYIGSRRDGGFAEYVVVPIWNLIKLDDDISYIEAATIEPFAVAYHAIKQAEIKEGDDVAVIGSGMIGFAAAQWAKLNGARNVLVIGRNNEKQEIAKKLNGIGYVCNNEKIEMVFNKVIDAVGTSETVELSIRLADSEGRIILIGNPQNDIFLRQKIYWRVLRKQLTLVGTWNSSYESGTKSDWTEVLKGIREKKIIPELLVTDIYDQTELLDALEMMKTHKKSYCKVMTVWNNPN